jgi:Ca-activated chloride channel family protein
MNPDDPKFTAYALGELHNEVDRAEVEKALNDNPELQKSLDEIRSVSRLLEEALNDEPAADLTDEQKLQIDTHLQASPTPAAKSNLSQLWPYLALAACLILTVPMLFIPAMNKVRQPSGVSQFEQDTPDTPRRSDTKTEDREHNIQPSERQQLKYQKTNDSVAKGQSLASAEMASVGAVVSEVASDKLTAGLEIHRGLIEEFDDATHSVGERVKNVGKKAQPYPVDERITSNYRLEEKEKRRRDLSEVSQGLSNFVAGQLTNESPTTTKREPSLLGSLADGRAAKDRVYERKIIGKTDGTTYYHSSIPVPEPPLPPIPGPQPVVVNGAFNTESYDSITDNPFLGAEQNPLSTFSTDVDTASYANMRRFLNQNQLPPIDAVRIEELINYFTYDYDPPRDKEVPFATHVEVANSPWETDHRLVRIGIKGYEVPWDKRPSSNLVFLIDVSGSMSPINKLPLVKQSLELLANRLGEKDRVAIVTYARSSQIALPSTTSNNSETLLHAITGLRAGGSTHASSGIEDAYKIAQKHFVENGNNRIILCTDGDFNVGVTNRGDLVRMIEEKARGGIYLSIFGFGMNNYKDATLEELSNKGNGNYGYIDALAEARKVFVEQISGTLFTIAKDVKIQVEFNPAQVHAYRLIGYENRKLAAEDFNDDTKDAGEIGAGHTVTALYEVVPTAIEMDLPDVDPLKYQNSAEISRENVSRELLTVKLRYKQPEADKSELIEIPIIDNNLKFDDASEDFRFAAAVASFGMILRNSPYKSASTLTLVQNIAELAQGDNTGGYRSEFLLLVDKVEIIKRADEDRRSEDVLFEEEHTEETP